MRFIGRFHAPTGDSTAYDRRVRSDVFISYRRTRFGEQVRRIAELLISQGVHVWLDDYSLFAIDILQDAALHPAILEGIALADRAVIFLTDDYGKSEYTRLEKSELEARLGGSAILRLDKHALGDEGAAAKMIIQQLGLAVSPPPTFVGGTSQPVEQNWLRDERAGYQFDATGWDVRMRSGRFLFGSYKGPVLARRDDPHQRGLTIDIGPAINNPGSATRRWMKTPKDDRLAIIQRALWDLFEGTPPENKDVSAKKLWNEGYRFGTRYAAVRHVSLRGTHIFLMGGNYHFALTYRSKHGWIRRYSIIATDHLTDLHIEVAIAIGFHGEFTEFCAAAQEMDALVHTFSRLGVGASRPPAVRPGSGSQRSEAVALTNAAYFDVEHGLIDEARAKLGAALQLYELADTHNEYGTVCLLSANYPEAKKHVVQAIVLEPENPKFWSCLSRLYVDLNRPSEALRCMVVVQTLDPDYPTVTKAMALLRREMGRRAEAPSHRRVAARIIEMRGRYHDGHPLDAEQLERILCEGL